MAKPKTNENTELLQVRVVPELSQRFFESNEYKIHGNIGAALRAILDKYLPPLQESQIKSE